MSTSRCEQSPTSEATILLIFLKFNRWAEVRIPWNFLYLISIGGCIRQYEDYGFFTPNMAFMVMATGFQFHACVKTLCS